MDVALDLLSSAKEGLTQLGVDSSDIDFYLDVMKRRLLSKQSASAWQRRWVQKHGKNFRELTKAYQMNVDKGIPVCDWVVSFDATLMKPIFRPGTKKYINMKV
jgi:hypothetical protein